MDEWRLIAIIDDNHKHQYFVEQKNYNFRLRTKEQRAVVGYVYCTMEEDALKINDIYIENEVSYNPPGHFAVLLTALRLQPHYINYRRRGLARQLLRFVQETARQKGLKRVYARVLQRDLSITPDLLEWYERRGFSVQRLNATEAGAIAEVTYQIQ